MGLAQVLLRWDPNPDQEPGAITLGYHVKIHAPEDEDVSAHRSALPFRVMLTSTALPLSQGTSTQQHSRGLCAMRP